MNNDTLSKTARIIVGGMGVVSVAAVCTTALWFYIWVIISSLVTFSPSLVVCGHWFVTLSRKTQMY